MLLHDQCFGNLDVPAGVRVGDEVVSLNREPIERPLAHELSERTRAAHCPVGQMELGVQRASGMPAPRLRTDEVERAIAAAEELHGGSAGCDISPGLCKN
eukprot:731057-Pleurochrysis_carterae.AAC.2